MSIYKYCLVYTIRYNVADHSDLSVEEIIKEAYGRIRDQMEGETLEMISPFEILKTAQC